MDWRRLRSYARCGSQQRRGPQTLESSSPKWMVRGLPLQSRLRLVERPSWSRYRWRDAHSFRLPQRMSQYRSSARSLCPPHKARRHHHLERSNRTYPPHRRERTPPSHRCEQGIWLPPVPFQCIIEIGNLGCRISGNRIRKVERERPRGIPRAPWNDRQGAGAPFARSGYLHAVSLGRPCDAKKRKRSNGSAYADA